MGRRRSSYVCPKCGKQGSLRTKDNRNSHYPGTLTKEHLYCEHYDHMTGKTTTCYVDKLEEQRRKEEISKHPYKLTLTEIEKVKESSNEFFRDYKIFKDRILKHQYPLTEEEKENIKLADEFVKMIDNFGAMYMKLISCRYSSDAPKDEEKLDNMITKAENIIKRNSTQEAILNSPWMKAIAPIMIKYELPRRMAKRKELRTKYSEGAFGSNKWKNPDYSGSVSPIT
jgi:hypothetical protein